MAEEKTDLVPYEVAFVYKCRICKQLHSEYGRLRQSGVVLTHQNELKERLLELVKENFSKAHPKKAFMYSDLTVHEFVTGNKTVVDPKTIKVRGKPQPEEKEEIPQIEKVAPLETGDLKKKMSFDEITAVVRARLAELGGSVKEYDKAIKELITATEVAEKEMKSLGVLLDRTNSVETKSQKEKKK